jgi:hypothetical protein
MWNKRGGKPYSCLPPTSHRCCGVVAVHFSNLDMPDLPTKTCCPGGGQHRTTTRGPGSHCYQ